MSNQGFRFLFDALHTGQTWSSLGVTTQKLYAYQRPHGSGSQTALKEMVIAGLEIKKAEFNYISDGMSDAVRQIDNDDNGPGAIGYSYLCYVNTLVVNSGIKLLVGNGVAPAALAVQTLLTIVRQMLLGRKNIKQDLLLYTPSTWWWPERC